MTRRDVINSFDVYDLAEFLLVISESLTCIDTDVLYNWLNTEEHKNTSLVTKLYNSNSNITAIRRFSMLDFIAFIQEFVQDYKRKNSYTTSMTNLLDWLKSDIGLIDYFNKHKE